MERFLIIVTILLSTDLMAVSLFQKIPDQPIVEWINLDTLTNNKNILKIHYFWASWCAPCVHSGNELAKIKAALKDRVLIYAYSSEDRKIIDKYLEEKYPSKALPFAYIKIPKKSQPADLAFWAEGLPYIFVTQNDILLWHGNPVYPIQKFRLFFSLWKAGKWQANLVPQKIVDQLNTASLMKKITAEKDDKLIRLIELEKELLNTYKKMQKNDPNYGDFSKVTQSQIRIFEYRNQLSREYQPQSIQDFLKIRNKYLEDTIEDFKDSRENLFYMARDLIFAEKKYQNLDMAERIILQANKITDQPTPYPDYNLWVVGMLYMEKMNWKKAIHFNEKAIKSCKTMEHCPQFLKMYQESLDEMRESIKTVCDLK